MSHPDPDEDALCVTFGFCTTAASPGSISGALGIRSDRSMHNLPPTPSDWWLLSTIGSSNPVHHLQDLLDRLEGVEERIDPHWNPQFLVTWTNAAHLPAQGQVYPADVIAGIARCKAELWIEIREDER